jgi:hypothetical protein
MAPMPSDRASVERSSGLSSLGRSAMAASARAIPSPNKSISRSDSPDRLAIFLPSGPSTRPKATCTALVPGGR